MKRNPSYTLTYISGTPYLLPFGQSNADFRHGLMLNDTGAFLWEHIEQTETIDDLVSLAMSHYHCTDADFPAIDGTIHCFVDSLCARNILIRTTAPSTFTAPVKKLRIAGLYCILYGPENLFAKELSAFESNEEISANDSVQEIRLVSSMPPSIPYGKMLLHNAELCVMESENEFILHYPSSQCIREARLAKTGSSGCIYYDPLQTEDTPADIMYTIRTLFLYFAQIHGMIAIHSSSVLYRDKAWLFAASSGVGKSTHAGLWHNHLNTPIINGDLNLITMQSKIPMVHGTPWCGTSGIYQTASYPLGGLTFLQRGDTDQIIALPEDRQQLHLLNRCISPNWTEHLLNRNLSVIQKIYPHIFMCCLSCTPTEQAVSCMQEAIDRYLEVPIL